MTQLNLFGESKTTFDEEGMAIPNVTTEVEQWGSLIGWLRKKDYTPEMVRKTIEHFEKEETKEDDDVLAGS